MKIEAEAKSISATGMAIARGLALEAGSRPVFGNLGISTTGGVVVAWPLAVITTGVVLVFEPTTTVVLALAVLLKPLAQPMAVATLVWVSVRVVVQR